MFIYWQSAYIAIIAESHCVISDNIVTVRTNIFLLFFVPSCSLHQQVPCYYRFFIIIVHSFPPRDNLSLFLQHIDCSIKTFLSQSPINTSLVIPLIQLLLFNSEFSLKQFTNPILFSLYNT